MATGYTAYMGEGNGKVKGHHNNRLKGNTRTSAHNVEKENMIIQLEKTAISIRVNKKKLSTIRVTDQNYLLHLLFLKNLSCIVTNEPINESIWAVSLCCRF